MALAPYAILGTNPEEIILSPFRRASKALCQGISTRDVPLEFDERTLQRFEQATQVLPGPRCDASGASFTQSPPNEIVLPLMQLWNYVFHSARDQKSVDHDLVLLFNAVCAIYCLIFYKGV